MLWLAGAALMFAAACGNNTESGDSSADTSITTLPAETTVDENMMQEQDTGIVPRIDPALDSAARQKDDALPPK